MKFILGPQYFKLYVRNLIVVGTNIKIGLVVR